MATIFANVEVISANSGGSWFLTQLSYSEKFRTSLETGRDAWLTTGYIGQTKTIFNTEDPCAGWSAPQALICNSVPYLTPYYAMMNLAGSDSLNWQEFVEEVVYKPFDMNVELDGVTLDGDRQAWADGKDLVVAASLLTDDVVLTQYYTLTQSYLVTRADSSLPLVQNFTPMYFSSIDSTRTAPDLFGAGDLIATYESPRWGTSYVPVALSATHPANVPVIDATVASSAAPAAVASERAVEESVLSTGSFAVSYMGSDLAPPIELTTSGVNFISTVAKSGHTTLAASSTLRVADGGYLDNTAVAYLMRHMDNNDLLNDGFSVVSFMNSSSEGVSMGTQTIPESTAGLFGYATLQEDGSIQYCDDGMCVSTLSAHVFDATAWQSAVPTWIWSDGDVALRYYELAVTTVANETFGITAGVPGTLHLFISEDFTSGPLPTDTPTMDSYSNVFNVTRAGVADQGGWAHLYKVFGLGE